MVLFVWARKRSRQEGEFCGASVFRPGANFDDTRVNLDLVDYTRPEIPEIYLASVVPVPEPQTHGIVSCWHSVHRSNDVAANIGLSVGARSCDRGGLCRTDRSPQTAPETAPAATSPTASPIDAELRYTARKCVLVVSRVVPFICEISSAL